VFRKHRVLMAVAHPHSRVGRLGRGALPIAWSSLRALPTVIERRVVAVAPAAVAHPSDDRCRGAPGAPSARVLRARLLAPPIPRHVLSLLPPCLYLMNQTLRCGRAPRLMAAVTPRPRYSSPVIICTYSRPPCFSPTLLSDIFWSFPLSSLSCLYLPRRGTSQTPPLSSFE